MRNVLTIFQAENKDSLDQVFMTEVVKMDTVNAFLRYINRVCWCVGYRENKKYSI